MTLSSSVPCPCGTVHLLPVNDWILKQHKRYILSRCHLSIHIFGGVDLSVYWQLYWQPTWLTIDEVIDLLNSSRSLFVRHINFSCVSTFIRKTCLNVTLVNENKDNRFLLWTIDRFLFWFFSDCGFPNFLMSSIYQRCFVSFKWRYAHSTSRDNTPTDTSSLFLLRLNCI